MDQKLSVQSTLRLTKGGKIFGPGIATLLEEIEKSGSLRKSAMKMGLSYSKAWKMVHSCEDHLGFKLLVCQIGGTGGGGAKLTIEARELLDQYQAFEQEAHSVLQGLVDKYFDKYY